MSGPAAHARGRRLNVALWIILACAAVDAAARADDAGILNAAVLNTTDGQQIYEQVCQGCHMSAAQGAVGAAHFPALAKDATLASRQYMAITLLMGRRNMPAFGAKHAIGFGGPPATLSEEQIAAVINYVRSHFGNHYTDLITASEVRSLDQGAH
jgi:mono/diheme cytochrome c family protein